MPFSSTSVQLMSAVDPRAVTLDEYNLKSSASLGVSCAWGGTGSCGPTHLDNNVKSLAAKQARQMVSGASRLSSTEFLQTLRPKSNTGKWSRGHDGVTNAHHKLGKNVVAWLYEHMTPGQQRNLKDALHLDWNCRALALCRLPSNLISSRTEYPSRHALSGDRIDDPMNNSHRSKRGEEFLDLVHQEDGALSPRSEVYADLAHTTVMEIYHRYQGHLQTVGVGTDFVLNADEAAEVIGAVKHAEVLNLKIEGSLARPTHFNGDVWEESINGRFGKRQIEPICREITEADIERFDLMSEAALLQKLKKRRLRLANRLPSLRAWLNMEQDVTEDIYEMDDRYRVWCQKQREK